ncbi:MAG TPA: hypothetical protein DCG27_08545 [Alcanivorax sp.]|jgi:Flp pilus assembly pilin Flp|nr:hypothetical protein [Pseudomonadota bacterium]HAB08665.1 hypothetical protein [Alcanivorax sp.]HAD64080.1 hypothetical protein [Alcanivorax sp.]HCI10251.1 hypothetical protein [Alcanivorax sp.]|tara:strand:+ start:5772 stop:6026 length:255 start_codon:yes stop_codon:yes gene_type:complete
MKSLTIFTNVSQQLAARLFCRGRTQADKQRGASALEYIMLAAVIIAILVFLSTNTDVRAAISTAFSDIFKAGGEAAKDAATGAD